MKSATSRAAASDPLQRPDLQYIGVAAHPACAEFEPQNLGIVSMDMNGLIHEANDAFLAMSGYSETDLPLAMATITPPEWHDLDASKARQLAENGSCLPWQKRILTKNGHALPILIGAAALGPTESRIQYFVANTSGLLQTDVAILDYQSRLRRAATELSLSAERERQAIAGDLHDNIGQELAIAKLKLSKVRSETDGTVRASLDEISAQLSAALGSCSTLSHDLATPSLYRLGLVPAIKDLVTVLSRDNTLNISIEFFEDDIPLSHTAKIVLYRVVRELLINILKHGQASHVKISGTRAGDTLCIVVADDGIGFDVHNSFNDSSPGTGLGLFLVRERLWHLGGSFELKSTISEGTSATLKVPLERIESPVGRSE